MAPVKIKCIVIGDEGVGKTCMLKRLVKGSFDENEESTIGLESYRCEVDKEKLSQFERASEGFSINFFDTSGNSKFQTMCTSRYRTADAFIVAFNVNSRKSFESLGNINTENCYLGDIKKFSSIPHALLIVGMQCDCQGTRVVSQEEGNALATATTAGSETTNATYLEISSKTNDNIEETVEELSRLWLEGPGSAATSKPSQKGGNSKGCCLIS